MDFSISIDKPYIGMDEKDIQNTKCGPYYNSHLFEEHTYTWRSVQDCDFLTVICKDGKVTSVLEKYMNTHWNEEGTPKYVGITFFD